MYPMMRAPRKQVCRLSSWVCHVEVLMYMFAVGAIPLCKTRAGPRDGEKWKQRFKEELESLIQYVKINKENDNDWFSIRSDTSGIR